MLLRKRKYGGLLYVRILLNFISVALLFHLTLKDSSKCMVNFYWPTGISVYMFNSICIYLQQKYFLAFVPAVFWSRWRRLSLSTWRLRLETDVPDRWHISISCCCYYNQFIDSPPDSRVKCASRSCRGNKAPPANHLEHTCSVAGSDTFVEWAARTTSIHRGGIKANLWQRTILRIGKSSRGSSTWSWLYLVG